MMERELDQHANGTAAGKKDTIENGREEACDPTDETRDTATGRLPESESRTTPGRPSTPVVVLLDDSEAQSQTSDPKSPDDSEANTQLNDETTTSDNDASNEEKIIFKSRKRHRRIAAINEDACDRVRLPANQYETVLRRRAIRKQEDEVKESTSLSPTTVKTRSIFGAKVDQRYQEHEVEEDVDPLYDEEYGDISIGMKLNIIAGKIIVQCTNALSDGRASPAQLTGLIQRGDVLLSIDNISLVNLSVDQLMEGLSPLSSPHHGNSYKRSLHLRFAAGEGLKLLDKNDAVKKTPGDPAADGVKDIFGQYMSFVDQLSGVPMFEEKERPITPEEPVIAKAVEPPKTPSTAYKAAITDQIISMDVAEQMELDRRCYVSRFFVWNHHFSELLRASLTVVVHESEIHEVHLTLKQMIESGEKAMGGARKLFYGMEDVDKGKDTRSFKKWNSTLSLRSRASTRRRFVLEYAPIEESSEGESTSDTASFGSNGSDDEEEVTGDELLLQLAAHDEIWRRNVIEVLENAAKGIDAEGHESSEADAAPDAAAIQNIGAAPSLESLLLGEQVTNMLTTKKKSYALPPKDVTSVLFDLVTNLTVTPDEISLKGSNHAHVHEKLSMVPFHKVRHSSGDDAMFAAEFLASKALPAWLRSFRPLRWEQRRVLWPSNRAITGTSLASHTVSDDVLTQDSASTGYPSPSGRLKRKDLRQQIEDMELDSESRAETCFLVTFFFTREMLPFLSPKYMKSQAIGTEAALERHQNAVEFVKVYGAYLKLYSSLVYAAMMGAGEVIKCLLELARHDPTHKEATKQLSKSSSLVLYDPSMLSAVTERLYRIHTEQKRDRRQDLMTICVAAYPDLRPWQVREATTDNASTEDVATDEEFHEMYYEYLTLLLDPLAGHDAARADGDLVKEWCELSIQSSPKTSKESRQDGSSERSVRRKNFYLVASRSSYEHRFYKRDLFMLMQLSVQADEGDLALDLIDELLDNPVYTGDETVLSVVLSNLRNMARDALWLENLSKENMDETTLRKIFRLFDKMATNKSTATRKSITVSDELFALLQVCHGDDSEPTEKEIHFVNVLATDGTPAFALETLALWANAYPAPSTLIPALHILLQRGAHDGMRNELSGCLFRVKHARRQTHTQESSTAIHASSGPISGDTDVWRRMFDGTVPIEK